MVLGEMDVVWCVSLISSKSGLGDESLRFRATGAWTKAASAILSQWIISVSHISNPANFANKSTLKNVFDLARESQLLPHCLLYLQYQLTFR